ncbi:MAG: C4-type zinc ribbon domain-containing protein [Proteobacteria bacterium]|nr:C4-type zinc ribbon domain-containing protein [Pseudomonadota bacterium]
MVEELKTLISLQQIDSQILFLKQQSEIIPSEIKKIDDLISKFQKDLENENKKLIELEKRKKDKEREIEDLNEKIRKLKEKTSQIKTNKEYQALLGEIRKVEETIESAEENLLLIFYDIDEFKKRIEQNKRDRLSKKSELENEKRQLEEKINRLHNEIEKLKEMRKNIASNLPSELYEEYKELMKKHKGLAVTEVVNSVCQGCFLHIPPQLYVEIKLNQSIKYCPQCGRVLFFKAKENKEEQQVSSE